METTLNICPRCQQRFVRAQNSGDYVHKCHGTESLSNEDILVIGNWTDYSGSDNKVSSNVLKAQQPNKLKGTRAGIEGDKESGKRTSRGFPKSRYRTRQHYEYIDSTFKKQVERTDVDVEEYE